MYSVDALWLTGLAMLILGTVLGFVIANRLPAAGGRSRRALEKELEQLRSQQRNYQGDVNEHFHKTAQLLNQLSSSYRDVHNHLAQGADELCQTRPSLEQFPAKDDHVTIDQQSSSENLEPPRDYAPRSGRSGTLAEDYGLDKERKEDETVKPPPGMGA